MVTACDDSRRRRRAAIPNPKVCIVGTPVDGLLVSGSSVRSTAVPYLSIVPEVADIPVLPASAVIDVNIHRWRLTDGGNRRRCTSRLVEPLHYECPTKDLA